MENLDEKIERIQHVEVIEVIKSLEDEAPTNGSAMTLGRFKIFFIQVFIFCAFFVLRLIFRISELFKLH